MFSIEYTAAKGLKLLADEKGAWMVGTAAETLVGAELHTDANAASISNEANAITGFTASGLDTFQSQSGTVADGTYALEASCNTTPTAGAVFYKDIQTDFSLVDGKSYILVCKARHVGTGETWTIRFDSDASLGSVDNIIDNLVNTDTIYTEYAVTFVHDANHRYFGAREGGVANDGGVFFDAFSVRLAVPDLSTSNNGLGVHGSIVKSAVATGADLMAYSGFSASNYFMQPYNIDLDFGTGDFCFVGWLNELTNTSSEVVFQRDSVTSAQRISAVITPSGFLEFTINDGTTARTVTSSIVVDDGEDRLVGLVHSGGNIYIHLNGVLDASTTGSALLTLSNAAAILTFGVDVDTNSPLTNGSLSLWRAFDYALTAAQIKTIYNSEKILFRPDRVYTQVGETYSFDLYASALQPSSNTIKNKQESLGGNRETLVFREDTFWDISTLPVTGIEVDRIRRFLSSAMEGSVISFDPYGSIASPYDPVPCYIENDTFSENRLNNTDYFSFGFKVREL